VLNMFVAAIAAVVFSVLARRFRRQQLTYIFTAFFMVAYGVFAVGLEQPTSLWIWGFYLFGDLFSTLMVATFFSFLNDSVSSDAAKRLYGLVGFGGVAGGAFGASAVAVWISSLSLAGWLAIAAGLGAVILMVAWAAANAIPDYGTASDRSPAVSQATPSNPEKADRASAGNPALAGARLVFGSSYLLSIVAIVGLYELVSTVVDFQFTSAIVSFSADDAARSQNFATVYATTTWLSMFVQLFLTSFVMRRFGLATALLVLPCAIALASTGFLLVPTLVLGGLLSVADNGFSYSINQSSKEALYVPTTPEEKYQAKAFIDMFVQRFAKALGVGLSLLVGSWFHGPEGVRTLSFFLLPVLGLWGFAALNAGRRFKDLENAASPAKGEESE
jgi:AAA family ATP:ADP antiporter